MITYFYRYITEKIHQRFKNNRIIILIGSRQTGKTMIIKNYFANYLKPGERSIYFNFEKTADLEKFKDINYLEKFLSQQKLSLKNKLFIAIDEFQYLKNATKFLKIIYDEYPNIKILATGSSTIEIQKHLKESLSGRKKIYYVYPLHFEEYLLATGQNSLWDKLTLKNFLPEQINNFNENILLPFLVWGGYPRLADKYGLSDEEKKEELYDIYNSYIQKDIKGLISGENIMAFNNLLKLLAVQIGNLLNINELASATGLPRHEIQKYLSILEHTFIINRLPPYFFNKRKEISKMPKIYFTDQGIVNTILSDFNDVDARPNLGAIIENYVYNQIRHFTAISDSIYFWRNLEGAEVDFIWRRNGSLVPIEVKWKNFYQPDVPAGLLNFAKKHKGIKEGWIVNKNYYGTKKIFGVNFIFIPAGLLIKHLK